LLTYGKEQAQPETWQHCQEPEKPRGQQMNKTSEKIVTIIFYFWSTYSEVCFNLTWKSQMMIL
jgi:hypothetical protein